MTVVSQNSLLSRVAKALEPELEAFGCTQSEMEIEAYGYAPEAIAQAALEACRAEEMRQVLLTISQCEPGVPSEIDGDISCFYCSAYLAGREPHDPECSWTRARALLTKLDGRA